MRGQVGKKQLECVDSLKKHGGKLVYRQEEKTSTWTNRFGTETKRTSTETGYVHVDASGASLETYPVGTVTGLVAREMLSGAGFKRVKLSRTRSELVPIEAFLPTHAVTPPEASSEAEEIE
jgi:hypothetical protein